MNSLQKYNKYLEYTSIFREKSNLFENFCGKGLLLAQLCERNFGGTHPIGEGACRKYNKYLEYTSIFREKSNLFVVFAHIFMFLDSDIGGLVPRVLPLTSNL